MTNKQSNGMPRNPAKQSNRIPPTSTPIKTSSATATAAAAAAPRSPRRSPRRKGTGTGSLTTNNSHNNTNNTNSHAAKQNSYSAAQQQKLNEITFILSQPDIDLWALRELCLTDGGLIDGKNEYDMNMT